MSDREAFELARRLAAVLLVRNGELGVSDVEGLPFVDNPLIASYIVADLAQEYGVEIAERRIPGAIGAWEPAIRLGARGRTAQVPRTLAASA